MSHKHDNTINIPGYLPKVHHADYFGLNESHAVYTASNNLQTFLYDYPFYFSGANPIY